MELVDLIKVFEEFKSILNYAIGDSAQSELSISPFDLSKMQNLMRCAKDTQRMYFTRGLTQR